MCLVAAPSPPGVPFLRPEVVIYVTTVGKIGQNVNLSIHFLILSITFLESNWTRNYTSFIEPLDSLPCSQVHCLTLS